MELKNLGQTAASALIHTDIRLEREHWTMFRNKALGIAAAATLGLAAMLGSTAAHALKVCTEQPGTRAALAGATCADSTTFALETLLTGATNQTAAIDKSDTTKYYNINDDAIHLAATADIGGGGDDYTVTISLDGMVFKGVPSLTVNPNPNSATFTVATGGVAGDDEVEFELSTGTVDATAAVIRLDADFAVSTGGGTATLTMSNPSLQGTKTKTHGPAKVVSMMAALDETAKAMNATADVAADGFMKFVDDRTTATLGTLKVGFKTAHRKVSDGANVAQMGDIMQVGNNDETPPVPHSSVSFMGNFSFTSKVFVHGDADCGAASTDSHVANPNSDTDLASAETDLRVIEGTGDDATVTRKTSAVTLGAEGADFSTAQYLCIMVDPEADDAMPIPSTDAYTAMGSYTKIANAAIGPVPMEQTLGMIVRNGVTYHIPYITTFNGYNQRLVLVNRGGPARYEIKFTPEGGITASPSAMTGTLATGTSMMLTRNIVTLSGGSRTAASITVEATKGSVDVATVTINNSDGSSDTVSYREQ